VAEDCGTTVRSGKTCEDDLRISGADRIDASEIESVDQLRQLNLGIEGKRHAGDAETNVGLSQRVNR
jgi:hypothetical protein